MNTRTVAELMWWLSVSALAYTYVGYPVLLWIVNRRGAREVRRADFSEERLPTVTVLITAYNEERALPAKLENTLALDYPQDRLDILVASDCSSDRTDEIVREFAVRQAQNGGAPVRLYRQTQRLGKTSAQNGAVEVAHGDIILFSDATTHYNRDVLRSLVPDFADADVGCVAGRLIYVDENASNTGQGARSYWGYETFLKEHESGIWSLIGVSGCLYAVRRKAYVPMYPEACSDFLIATKMVEQGLRTIYQPRAVCTEETNDRTDKEFRMRVRVITQTFTDLWRHRYMLNPFAGGHRGFYAVQLFSHKVLRYLVPLLLIINFAASLALAPYSLLYLAAMLAHVCVYGAALVAHVLERFGVGNRLLAMPQYFVLANLASLYAFYKFLRGERYARWEPIREAVVTNPATVTRRSDAS